MSDYQILSQDEQDDIVVSFMLSQENDKFCHELNLRRFSLMLKSVPEGEWKTRLTQLKKDVVKRLTEVDSIIEATKPDMPPAERLKAAVQRLKDKKAAIPK